MVPNSSPPPALPGARALVRSLIRAAAVLLAAAALAPEFAPVFAQRAGTPLGPVVLANGGPAALDSELRAAIAAPSALRMRLVSTGEGREDWGLTLGGPAGSPGATAAPPRTVAEALDVATAVVLEGGHASAMWSVLNRVDRQGWIRRALDRARRRDVPMVAFGQACGALAWASLAPVESLPPPRNPRRAFTDLAPVVGLGWAGGVFVACDTGAGEGLGDWLPMAVRIRAARSLLLEGDVAWCFDPTTRTAEVTGPGRVWLLELEGARRAPGEVLGARLDLLGAGTAWDLRREAPLPRAPLGRRTVQGAALAEPGPAEPARWALALERAFAAGEAALPGLELDDPEAGWRLRLRWAEDSRLVDGSSPGARWPLRLVVDAVGLQR